MFEVKGREGFIASESDPRGGHITGPTGPRWVLTDDVSSALSGGLQLLLGILVLDGSCREL